MPIPLLIAAKDLRQRLRDRSALLIAIVVPLALGLIFSFALADVGDGDITFDYAVVDQGRGHIASAFVDGLLGDVERQGIIRLRTAASAEESPRLADRGTVAATFVVPAGFSEAVTAGRPNEIRIIGDPHADVGRRGPLPGRRVRRRRNRRPTRRRDGGARPGYHGSRCSRMRCVPSPTQPRTRGATAFATLVGRGGELGDVLQELGVLAAFATGLIVLATWQLRRALVR